MRQGRLVNKIQKIHHKSWIFNIFWSIVWVLWVCICVLQPEAKIWGSLGMEKSGNMFYYLVVTHTTVITHILWFPSLCRVLFLWHRLALGFSCAQSPLFPLQSASAQLLPAVFAKSTSNCSTGQVIFPNCYWNITWQRLSAKTDRPHLQIDFFR